MGIICMKEKEKIKTKSGSNCCHFQSKVKTIKIDYKIGQRLILDEKTEVHHTFTVLLYLNKSD